MKVALWAVIAVYAASRFLQVFPGPVPLLAVVTLHVIPPAIFALLHGARSYQWRGIFTFFGICLIVGNVFENLGVQTGFPYGHYYFTDAMGPKILTVPILLGLAYVGMAYLSWTVAEVIVGRARLIAVPMVAAFIMTSWDLSMDPVWSTILRAWVWQKGGAYFGAPVTNFFGWYLTVFVIYILFAVYTRGRKTLANPRLPVIFYGVSAAGNLLLVIPHPGVSIITDPAGITWRVGDILAATVLVSIFTMGAFTLMAWARLKHRGN